VQVTVMELQGEPIAISSAKLRPIPVVKFNSWLLEAVVSAANNDVACQEQYVRAMEGNPSSDISFEDKAHNYKHSLCIPEQLQRLKQILESAHDSKVAGHMGQDKSIELVRRNFFWPEMEKFIEDYVCPCPVCQKNKAA
jgi:hypothetical protein